MSWHNGLIFAALVLSAAISVLCSIAVLVKRGAMDKLHYVAPASILGAGFAVLAVLIKEGVFSKDGVKSLLILLVLLISGPAVTQAIARAKNTRSKYMPEK